MILTKKCYAVVNSMNSETEVDDVQRANSNFIWLNLNSNKLSSKNDFESLTDINYKGIWQIELSQQTKKAAVDPSENAISTNPF